MKIPAKYKYNGVSCAVIAVMAAMGLSIVFASSSALAATWDKQQAERNMILTLSGSVYEQRRHVSKKVIDDASNQEGNMNFVPVISVSEHMPARLHVKKLRVIVSDQAKG